MQIIEQNEISQANQRALPDRWVVALFDRLSALYGSQFADKWAGVKPEVMRATWAEKLGGFDAASITDALKNCDSRTFPPNLPEFVEMCRTSMRGRGTYVALEHKPTSREDAEKFLGTIGAEKFAKKEDSYDYKGWAKRIIDRRIAGERIPHFALKMAQEVYREPS